MENANLGKLTSMHFYAWKKGLKTGMYYLRTKAVAQAQQFTIEPENNADNNNDSDNQAPVPVLSCNRDNPDCEACGS